jgi:anti-sigma B factor antagonist
MLKITERQAADVTILDLEGNIIMGGGSALLNEAINRLVEDGRKKILLNLAEVKYLDSSGIGGLVSSSVALNRAGGDVSD